MRSAELPDAGVGWRIGRRDLHGRDWMIGSGSKEHDLIRVMASQPLDCTVYKTA